MMPKFVNVMADLGVSPSELELPNKSRVVDHNVVANVLHIVLGLAGSIALIIIIIAGLQYVLSQGNPQQAAKAKDTIIYALVGLVICLLGYAVVSFVVKGLGL